jgi:hypothetical protein
LCLAQNSRSSWVVAIPPIIDPEIDYLLNMSPILAIVWGYKAAPSITQFPPFFFKRGR